MFMQCCCFGISFYLKIYDVNVAINHYSYVCKLYTPIRTLDMMLTLVFRQILLI